MLGGKIDFLDKLNGEKVLIGYDLGDQFSQISYCAYGGDNPETLSIVAGSENYNISTVLCKRNGVNQWFYGKEAIRQAGEKTGILIDNLVALAREGERISIEGEEFDPVSLLTLFVKKSLALLSMVTSLDKIGGIMFTCSNLDQRMVEILVQVSAGLSLKTKNIYFQGHIESVYYYTIYQPTELWQHQVMTCEYCEDGIRIYRMECNKRTTPVVAFIDEEIHAFRSIGSLPSDERYREEACQDMDRKLFDILSEICEGRLISSVYLLGEGFSEEWMKESLRFLCRNRRVFQGNNLYSKGACYSIMEKYSASENGKNYVFLGNEKLKSNIGMKVVRRGVDSYFTLLDAGVNWFEAKKECEFILEEDPFITILISPLNGKDAKSIEIGLEGLPERPIATTRISLLVDMISENRVQFRMQDKGFGDIFPASQLKWKKIIEV